MPSEIKIQCECGHTTPISKSNISAHRKTKVHLKNMSAIGNNPQTELENTIICSEVVIKNKPEKIVKPKCIVCNKRQISKDSLRSRKQKCNKCWNQYMNEKYFPKNKKEEEEEEEEDEDVKPVEEVIEIIEDVKPVKTFSISFNFDFTFLEEAEEEYIKKNYTIKTVKPVEEIVKAVEEMIQTIEVKPSEGINELIEEMTKMIEEVELVEDVIKMIEEIKPVEEVIQEVEEVGDKKINHKEIPNSNWFEYIPDDETYSTLILTYAKDNLKIDKRIMEFLKVRYIYLRDRCEIQIYASDDIADTYPISFHQCNTKEEHFKGNSNAFSIWVDPSIEFKADFLKKKKYNNFKRSRMYKVAKFDDDDASIFPKIEKEILQYSKMISEEKKKDRCMPIVVKEKPRQKNYMKILPTDILDIIYEYARDDTNKKNFVKTFPLCYGLLQNYYKPTEIKSVLYNGNKSFTVLIKDEGEPIKVYGITVHKHWEEIEHFLQQFHGFEDTEWQYISDQYYQGEDFGYDRILRYYDNHDDFWILAKSLEIKIR